MRSALHSEVDNSPSNIALIKCLAANQKGEKWNDYSDIYLEVRH